MNLQEALDTRTESRRGELKRLLRFTGAGAIAAVANVASRMGFSRVFAYPVAVTAAYLVGMVVAFTLSRMFVFEGGSGTWKKELLRFSMVNAAAFLQVWVVSLLLADWLFPKLGYHWHTETTAHVIGVASPILFSYLGHKHFSFRG